MITLLNVGPGTKVVIRDISGGRGVRKNLADLGLGIGSVLTVEGTAPFRGPLRIRHDGTLIVVGHGIAAKVRVERISRCE
jgi:ferrous iron transport protein A